MATLETAALQLDIAWEDPDENFRRAEELAARAASAGARLLVLPEMFATGFSMDAARMAPHGPRARDFLAATAERHGVYVLGGYAEPGPAAARARETPAPFIRPRAPSSCATTRSILSASPAKTRSTRVAISCPRSRSRECG